MKQRFYRFRIFGFPVILFVVAFCLYLSNIKTAPSLEGSLFFSSDRNVILGLYQATNFIYLFTRNIIPANFLPFLLLFIGMVGVFQLLVSLKLYTNRYLPFIGSIFYGLNIGTFWFFSYVSLPLLFLFAFLPWQVWILFQIMKGRSLKRGEKLVIFFFIQLCMAPAFSYPNSFTFFLALIAILCFSMLFSRSFFRVMSHGPVYIVFLILLNLYWFLPRLYLLIDNNKTVLAFKDQVNQSLKVITITQFLEYIHLQPPIVVGIQWLFTGIIILGIVKISRYHFPFLLTSLVLSLPFWLRTADIPELKSFLAAITLPSVIFFLLAASFFFVNGLSMILAIYTFFHKRVKRHRAHQNTAYVQTFLRSPFEIYQELIQLTHENHPKHHFTPLQFTEYFLHHLLRVKTTHTSRTEKQQHLEVRYLCYAIFLLLVVAGISGFQGKYFGQSDRSTINKKDDIRLVEILNTLSPEKRAIMSQYTNELDHALAKEDKAGIERVFKKYGLQNKDPVQLFQNLPAVGPKEDGILEDTAFKNHSNYYTNDTSTLDAYYPFRFVDGNDFSVQGKNTVLKQKIEQSLMKRLGDYDLESGTESAEIAVVNSTGQSLAFDVSPYVEMNGDTLSLHFESRPIEAVKPNQFISTACTDGFSTDCYSFDHKGLEHQYGYLITVTSTSKTPDILPFVIEDLKHTHTYFDGKIASVEQNIVLPPSYIHGVGYSFIMKSQNFKDWTIHISYLPYSDIKDVRFVSRNGIPQGIARQTLPVKKYTAALYEIQLPALPDANTMTLAFYQDIDDGWKAYKTDPRKMRNFFDTLFIKLYPFAYTNELGTHGSFNTWANSWRLNKDWSNSTVLLIFWPQYLEYAGIAIVSILFLIFSTIRFFEWYKELRD